MGANVLQDTVSTSFQVDDAGNILELKNIVKTYTLGSQQINALKNINLALKTGDFLAISGPSGSGKSTLLNIIALLDTPTSGTVEYEGMDVTTMKDRQITKFRSKKVGIVFQNYNLIPVLNAVENVAFPLQLQSFGKLECIEKSKEMLARVGLGKHFDHRPAKLSGGQRQRVAIARALVTEPEVVIADEPTAALDSKTGMEIVELMKGLNKSENTTFVFSTHDPRITSCVSNVIELVDGRITNDKYGA